MKKGVFIFIMICFLTACTSTVRVRRGDTLYSIAQRKNVPLRALIQENHLSPPYTIKVGQTLKIPTKKTYTVRRGDTLYSIARKFDSNVTDVARQNNLKAPYLLKPGQKLVVKSWAEDPAPATNTASKVTKTTQKTTSQSSVQIPSSAKNKRFYRPVQGKIINPFGTNQSGVHNDGINISAKAGTPILAAEKGVVSYAGNDLKGYGNLILLKHEGGWFTAYAHADKISVKQGDSVKAKQKIGVVGQTGNVKTPQLHFEIRYKTKPVDPNLYLK